MASYKKPNMSQLNSAINKIKSANRQFENQANKAIRDLKALERQARSYQTELRSTSTPSLSTVPSLYLGAAGSLELGYLSHSEVEVKSFDVFISHATEDKNDVARPLTEKLRSHGLIVWYDEFELRIGDSLRRKIDRGIANSNFGVIVISRDFIKKGWTNYELDGLITRAVNGDQVILPILHNITRKEVLDYSASLADKISRNTTEFTIEEIADEIADVIIARKGAY